MLSLIVEISRWMIEWMKNCNLSILILIYGTIHVVLLAIICLVLVSIADDMTKKEDKLSDEENSKRMKFTD